MENRINHHAKILSLIDDNMMSLTDLLRLLYPLIQIGQRCQIVYIEGLVRDVH